jgi:ABC-type multidrug transport system fused ATPase/permease subunit
MNTTANWTVRFVLFREGQKWGLKDWVEKIENCLFFFFKFTFIIIIEYVYYWPYSFVFIVVLLLLFYFCCYLLFLSIIIYMIIVLYLLVILFVLSGDNSYCFKSNKKIRNKKTTNTEPYDPLPNSLLFIKSFKGVNYPWKNLLSFSLKGGEKIGVCGTTGAGKTSLLFALLRLVECRVFLYKIRVFSV